MKPTPTPEQIEAAAIALNEVADGLTYRSGAWPLGIKEARKDFWRGYAEEALSAALSASSREGER